MTMIEALDEYLGSLDEDDWHENAVDLVESAFIAGWNARWYADNH